LAQPGPVQDQAGDRSANGTADGGLKSNEKPKLPVRGPPVNVLEVVIQILNSIFLSEKGRLALSS
jgi:hypothetical protein